MRGVRVRSPMLPHAWAKSTNYARVYRTRLLGQGVIDAPRRGYVTFEMPLLRAYLSEEL